MQKIKTRTCVVSQQHMYICVHQKKFSAKVIIAQCLLLGSPFLSANFLYNSPRTFWGVSVTRGVYVCSSSAIDTNISTLVVIINQSLKS